MKEETLARYKELIAFADDNLEVILLGLTGFGLLMSTLFFALGMLVGSEWVALCGILVGSNSLQVGASHLGKRRDS